MSITRNPRPYWNHIAHYDVTQGEIGAKQDGKLEILWQLNDGRLFLVCPNCVKIQDVPTEFVMAGNFSGVISCMCCTYCRADYSYTLVGWRESKTSPSSGADKR